MIGDYQPVVPNLILVQSEAAVTAIAKLDTAHGNYLEVLSALLLRSESVASSKIEQIAASIEDFARASHSIKSNPSAVSMVASTEALDRLIGSVESHGELTLENILAAHRTLMADDPIEAFDGGRLRGVQNWIGGSEHSPRNTLYTPPPPETVADYMVDLLKFVNRDDLPTLVQAAVAHAQFESIHPFNDGNGRIGRALINAILRRRGITVGIVIPLATALVADRATYFGVLTAYRRGNTGPIIRAIALAAEAAAVEAEQSAELLSGLTDQWTTMYADEFEWAPRTGSAALKIIEQLSSTPFFTIDEMQDLLGGATSAIYSAVAKLQRAGIVRELTHRERNQVWCAGSVVDELDDLGHRVAHKISVDERWQALRTEILTL